MRSRRSGPTRSGVVPISGGKGSPSALEVSGVSFNALILPCDRAHVEVECRLGDVLVEQMHVRVERERRLVMPKPPLHLHGVPAAAERHRRACVAERVESDP